MTKVDFLTPINRAKLKESADRSERGVPPKQVMLSECQSLFLFSVRFLPPRGVAKEREVMDD